MYKNNKKLNKIRMKLTRSYFPFLVILSLCILTIVLLTFNTKIRVKNSFTAEIVSNNNYYSIVLNHKLDSDKILSPAFIYNDKNIEVKKIEFTDVKIKNNRTYISVDKDIMKQINDLDRDSLNIDISIKEESLLYRIIFKGGKNGV